MVTNDQLEASKTIQRQTGLTFHIATRLLPQRVRHATYVLYAFFRLADDVVDDPDPAPPERQQRELERIRKGANGETTPSSPVLKAFNDIREQYGISEQEIAVFIDAMEQDIGNGSTCTPSVEFTDATEMEHYLRGSAVAVGYMMLAVMEPSSPHTARPHAKALGEAFQLTNFLRDVREDIDEYQRVYLPQSTLDRAEASIEDIAAYRPTPAFRQAMRLELERAEEKYRTGVAGIQYLPKDCQFPVLMAAVFYAEYHRLIRARHYDVLTDPPSLNAAQYAVLLVKTWLHWKRTHDPEQTFYHVAPVEQKGKVRQNHSRWQAINQYLGKQRASWLE